MVSELVPNGLKSNTTTTPASTLDLHRLAVLESIGDPDFVRELLQDFMRNFELTLVALQDCMRDKNTESVALLCHSTRSSAANVGASCLAAACVRLEDQATKFPLDSIAHQALVDEICAHAPALRVAVAVYRPHQV
ncbi:MAG: Hpt domain-containing protein [Bdellovibrionota bacterium]